MKIIHKISFGVSILVLLIGSIFKFASLDMDTIIIRYGIATYRLLNTMSLFLIIAGFVMIFVTLLAILFAPSKAKTIEKKGSSTFTLATSKTLTDEKILQKIQELKADPDQDMSLYKEYLNTATQQIKKINEQIEDLTELQEDNQYDVLNKAQDSMDQGKQQILTNIKNIINRVTIKGETTSIDDRLKENQQIIEKAKSLLNEVVNYLDDKTSTTDNDLENR